MNIADYFKDNRGLQCLDYAQYRCGEGHRNIIALGPEFGDFSGTGCSDLSLFPNYSYVQFLPGKITCYPISTYQIGFSSDFTGCIMAYFILKNQAYIAHITIGGEDCRKKWNTFIESNRKYITKYLVFRPFKPGTRIYNFSINNFHIFNSCRCVGLINGDGSSCYSMLVKKGPDSKYVHIMSENMIDSSHHTDSLRDLSLLSIRYNLEIPSTTFGSRW